MISEGGGVWPRTRQVDPAVARRRSGRSGSRTSALAPNDLIRAILRAPVDLLWNGGIGTVVKASDETDDAAQDRSSDAIRVDARELRCRVVGEGGNLGFTRRARVEFARGGGRINADFIDNSAGVDCSDHEVNLKILLGLAERAGELTRPDRDELLRDVTEDVVEHVLYDSFLQAQIIAQEARRSASRLYAYEDLMVVLEEDGLLDRAVGGPAVGRGAGRAPARGARDGAAGAGAAARLREAAGQALAARVRRCSRTRGSSATCAATSRRRSSSASARCSASTRCGASCCATINANLVVNALGPTFVSQLVAERGARPAEVVRAYRIAREVTGAEAAGRRSRTSRARSSREVQAELMGGVDALVDAVDALVPVRGARRRPRRRRSRPAARASSGSRRRRRRSAPRSCTAPAARSPSGSSPPASPRSSRAPTRCARGWCTRRR